MKDLRILLAMNARGFRSVIQAEGETGEPAPRGGEDGIGDGRSGHGDGGFSGAGGGDVAAVYEVNFNLRNIGEARHAVVRQAARTLGGHVEANLFEQRTADAHDQGSGDLV